ncbi:MAG: hypothetical protein ACKOED_02760 [Aestuariivirga sp.]|uniref:hypothetical protein n=1 Tax=Aestuariivirga sp. TaxID=2650926 RepID=UPI0038D1B543
MDNSTASSVLALREARRFDGCDIAEGPGSHEAARIIHAGREARRKAAVAA